MNEAVRAKARLRTELAHRAAAISETQRRAAEPLMRERMLELPEVREASSVLVCLSFGTEPETRPLIDALLAEGKTVYLPRADRSDRQLHLHRWPCELRMLHFGLAQPVASAPELGHERIDDSVDVAIVLGLAYDVSGIRLGHGSGYVDRFLTAHPVPTVALTYADLVVDELPRATYDVPMTLLVTEDRVVRPVHDPRQELRGWPSLDHREIDALLSEALSDDGFAPEPFARFRERLLRHIGIEEKILFPAARRLDPGRDADRLARLRVDHGALTSLLVPTPDRDLANEIRALLPEHNKIEEDDEGVYDTCIDALDADDALEVLRAARARRPVPTTGYFDGQGTVRTAAKALAKARRSRR